MTSTALKARSLDRLSALVDAQLRRALPASGDVPAVVHEAMRYAVLSGGKRFRPLLCLGACRAVGGSVRRALTAACAVELIHAYSLVHDDLPAMDDASERRGHPSCHRKYGEANAILAGDALLTLAFELLSRNGTVSALPCLRVLGRASGTVGLIGGQILDLQAISRSGPLTEETLTRIAERKTGALITASVEAGALAGGARASRLTPLRRYGRAIGLAFQLVDDVHDRDGFAQVLGADQARAQAERLVRRALAALEPFGRRAAVLRQLAEWLIRT